jgi:hypothetical protein
MDYNAQLSHVGGYLLTQYWPLLHSYYNLLLIQFSSYVSEHGYIISLKSKNKSEKYPNKEYFWHIFWLAK